jgi:hypothetical protein
MLSIKRKECSPYEHEKAKPEESRAKDAAEAGAEEAGSKSQYASGRPEASRP